MKKISKGPKLQDVFTSSPANSILGKGEIIKKRPVKNSKACVNLYRDRRRRGEKKTPKKCGEKRRTHRDNDEQNEDPLRRKGRQKKKS